ncbi:MULTISPECIES: CheR family methyltransferase [Geobacter]|uniref:CheR family methyltransferase n=1 Tax=Geobacter TaxID=28231 RepID=UPI0025724BA1|nr:CheR family methyltransferase [Geobacter sulfurreducens]BEH08816.1 Chemotaxis protein methyltransferase 2 [Geobacter sulfurreducens subsp. ethanolicus]BET60316.1 Chemotaxis protein methyltransferase 2 [Geobacter sp. 60473]
MNMIQGQWPAAATVAATGRGDAGGAGRRGNSPQGATGLHQFRYTDNDFERIRELIHRCAGISLNPGKQHMVYSRLARRLRVRRVPSFADYIDLVERGDQAEIEEFINALTTNLTAFFREPHHFPLLARHLDRLVSHRRSLAVWSSAASSGEEPYSLAMTVVEHFGSFNPPVKIYASDIDTSALDRARRGVYAAERVRDMSPSRMKRFFLRGEGKNAGYVRVKPELQRLVTFERLNLLDEQWPLAERFDAIFCRNVMIYFDKTTQYQVLKRFVPRLQPEGLLFAGHSESFHQASDLFRLCGKTVYSPVGIARDGNREAP